MYENGKKRVMRAASMAAAVCMAFSSAVTVGAAKVELGEGLQKVVDAINKTEGAFDRTMRSDADTAYYSPNLHNYSVSDPFIYYEPLPEKYDLRDVDGKCYVPEIRNQNPFSTCWSFSAVAASEISYASAIDFDFNTASDEEKAMLDFSEKHLAWFLYDPLEEGNDFYPDQAGEGIHPYVMEDKNSKLTSEEKTQSILDLGGYMFGASGLFSAGIGPAPESEVPYFNSKGEYLGYLALIQYNGPGAEPTIETVYDYEPVDPYEFIELLEDYKKEYKEFEDYYNGYSDSDPYGKYYMSDLTRSDKGDWSVDKELRFMGPELTESNLLPSPSNSGKNGEYIYNELGTYAIKKEIFNGRAVSIGYLSDQSLPGDMIDENQTFLKFSNSDGTAADGSSADIWAQYTYDMEYDPDDPDSINKAMAYSNHAVTIVGYDDTFPKDFFNDPKGTIGGDGAFIVRNSWGSADNSDPAAVNNWGSGGSGYFYLSYYDQSIVLPESYEFRTEYENGIEAIGMDMYDTMPTFWLNDITFTNDVYMSNVFEAPEDEIIRYIGINTGTPNCSVKYAVYLLDEGHTDPTDGEMVLIADNSFEYAGYHRIDLGQAVAVQKGQKYSIIAKVTREDGKKAIQVSCAVNDSGTKYYEDLLLQDMEEDEKYDIFTYYSKAVVNPGESYIGARTSDGVEWADWADVIASIREDNAELNNDGFDYDNFCIRSYPQAEVINVKNEIVNKKSVYYVGDTLEGRITIGNSASEDLDDIEISCSLGELGSGNSRGKVSVLKAGTEKVIDYVYVIKPEDAERGVLRSEVSLTMEGETVDPLENVTVNSFIVQTAYKLPNSDVSGDSTAADSNPATGADLTAVLSLMSLSVFAALGFKKKNS